MQQGTGAQTDQQTARRAGTRTVRFPTRSERGAVDTPEVDGEGDGGKPPRRSGGPGSRATVRTPAILVAVGVFLALTAGVAVGAGDLGSAPGTASDQLERTAVLDNPGQHTRHQVDSVDGQAGDGQRQADDPSVNVCNREAATFVRVYNSQVESVPGLVTDRIRNSNVHLQVDGDADRDYTMVADEDAQVVDYSEGKPEEASLRVETDCATFQEITDSQRPGETFQAAYADGRVKFVGLGPVNYVFFEGLDRVTDPIAWAVLLGLFLLLLLVLYLFYRRLTLYYREDEDEDGEGSAAGAGPPPDEGPPAQQPPDPTAQTGQPPRQAQQGSASNARGAERQPTRGAGVGQQGGPGGPAEPRSGEPTEPHSNPGSNHPTGDNSQPRSNPGSDPPTAPGEPPESGDPTERRDGDSPRSQNRDDPEGDESDTSSTTRRG